MFDSERERARLLLDYEVIGTPPEPNFDRITQIAAAIFHAPIATISLVDHQRYWFKSKVGVTASEMPRRMSFCDHTISSDKVFVVPDALNNPHFVNAPIVAGPPHVRWYAGAPLVTPSGVPIGSLCVLDTEPRAHLAGDQAAILRNLAGTVVELLEARNRQRQLVERTAEIARLACLDPLTGLVNRRSLHEKLTRALSNARADRQVAMLCVDLDEFKRVNDTLGHPAGDVVLQQVAERLRHAVRVGDIVARLGGDEFAILQCGLPDAHQATQVAERVIEELNMPFPLDGHMVKVGACVGIAVDNDGKSTPDEISRNADIALYKAKQEGGNCYRFFHAGSSKG